MNALIQFDQNLFFILNGMHNPYWDMIMSLFTGKTYWLPFYIVIVWFIIKNFKSRTIFIFLLLALAIVASDQLTNLIKETVQRFRPTHEPTIQNFVHFVKNKGGLFGFFSAHAANTFTVAMFTSLVFKNKPFTFLIFFWALMVSYTRIYLGLHYPLDIFTGMIFGLLLGFCTYKLLNFSERYFPALEKVKLNNRDFSYIFLFFLSMITTTFFVVFKIGNLLI